MRANCQSKLCTQMHMKLIFDFILALLYIHRDKYVIIVRICLMQLLLATKLFQHANVCLIQIMASNNCNRAIVKF